jgi:hypothetical protein
MYNLADTTYDLNQSHHPILVTGGPFEGFTGETIEQNADDPTKISCVLVRANGSAFRWSVKYIHLKSRFAPSTGLTETYYRREGVLGRGFARKSA